MKATTSTNQKTNSSVCFSWMWRTMSYTRLWNRSPSSTSTITEMRKEKLWGSRNKVGLKLRLRPCSSRLIGSSSTSRLPSFKRSTMSSISPLHSISIHFYWRIGIRPYRFRRKWESSETRKRNTQLLSKAWRSLALKISTSWTSYRKPQCSWKVKNVGTCKTKTSWITRSASRTWQNMWHQNTLNCLKTTEMQRMKK